MRYERRYIQYNDLVFDGYEMLNEYDASNVSFKVNTYPYSFRHGSYAPFKSSHVLVDESSVSITLWLKEKKLPCEQRPFYRSFVIEQLSKHGKLWAVQDNTLVWAYATVTNYSEMVEHYNGKVGIDIDFMLYEGVWHKADKQKTFIHPYDLCTYLDCYDYKQYQPCDILVPLDCCGTSGGSAIVGEAIVGEAVIGGGGSSHPICLTRQPEPEHSKYCCECDCDKVTEDMALCYHLDELQDVYKYCSDFGFKVVYDCDAAERFFNILGQELCTDACHNGVLAGKIYSETDIPTSGVTVTLVGKMHNPYVEINGNGNWIAGDYDGRLRIQSNGDVYYENGCHCDDPLPPDVWQKPADMVYGWTILPRYNRVVVNLGACCGRACAYFNIDNLTI